MMGQVEDPPLIIIGNMQMPSYKKIICFGCLLSIYHAAKEKTSSFQLLYLGVCCYNSHQGSHVKSSEAYC